MSNYRYKVSHLLYCYTNSVFGNKATINRDRLRDIYPHHRHHFRIKFDKTIDAENAKNMMLEALTKKFEDNNAINKEHSVLPDTIALKKHTDIIFSIEKNMYGEKYLSVLIA
tara:strand:- start:72 stop:407 length:336 start_codon:yes stop_codon:yes gene_type:complete